MSMKKKKSYDEVPRTETLVSIISLDEACKIPIIQLGYAT
jgi:hypothetical protein